MAETESNLKVKLLLSLLKQFPQLPKSVVQNVMKQCNNDKEKCLEELTKVSQKSHTSPNSVGSLNNQMLRLNFDSARPEAPKYNKNSPGSASQTPELNPASSSSRIDYSPFLNPVTATVSNSNIPIIPPHKTPNAIRQISVHHIQTERDPNSYNDGSKYMSPQMFGGSYSSSPHNDSLHWSKPDPLRLPPPQHSTHANIFIGPQQAGRYNPTVSISKGRQLDFDAVSMLHPVHNTTTIHSPQPSLHGSQPNSPYSPQTLVGNHSPHMTAAGQGYITPKQSPTQISQAMDYRQMSESPFDYRFAKAPIACPNNKTTTVLVYRPANNTYVHTVSPNIALSPQPEKLIHSYGSSQDDQAYINALLNHQRQRYDKLLEDYNNLLKKTEELTSEIDAIQRNRKQQTVHTPADLSKLRYEIRCMLKLVDAHSNGQTPIGVLDPLEQQNFYKNMNTGQSGSLFAQDVVVSETPPPLPPRRPETPQMLLPSQPQNDFEGEHWNCSACTFLNHPALEKCEECEFPRNSKEWLDLGRISSC
ncbi:TGF-beta-activated kinase 1 and MAP3K7-binding protein 2-like isoform X2 [Argonauta hians]